MGGVEEGMEEVGLEVKVKLGKEVESKEDGTVRRGRLW